MGGRRRETDLYIEHRVEDKHKTNVTVVPLHTGDWVSPSPSTPCTILSSPSVLIWNRGLSRGLVRLGSHRLTPNRPVLQGKRHKLQVGTGPRSEQDQKVYTSTTASDHTLGIYSLVQNRINSRKLPREDVVRATLHHHSVPGPRVCTNGPVRVKTPCVLCRRTTEVTAGISHKREDEKDFTSGVVCVSEDECSTFPGVTSTLVPVSNRTF